MILRNMYIKTKLFMSAGVDKDRLNTRILQTIILLSMLYYGQAIHQVRYVYKYIFHFIFIKTK